MKWTPAILAAPAALVLHAPAGATIYLNVQQAQQAILPGRSLTAVEPGRSWKAADGSLFVVDRAVGKHEMITYAVGIGPDGAVRGIEIMEYRESYGYEVRSASWRRQFVGLTAANPPQFGANVQNIGGATLSCKHLTESVARVLARYGRTAG